MDLKSSKTLTNLARAYAAECQARTRYEFIEYGARMNDYKNIADIIDEIAFQEFNHARMFYTFIQKADKTKIENIEIKAGYPFKEKWDLLENLKLGAEDEITDASAYEEFALVAKEEGFNDIAKLFEQVKKIELYHKKIFEELYDQMKNGTLYSKKSEVVWVCADCGYAQKSKDCWDECPVCNAKRGSAKLILETKKCIEKYC